MSWVTARHYPSRLLAWNLRRYATVNAPLQKKPTVKRGAKNSASSSASAQKTATAPSARTDVKGSSLTFKARQHIGTTGAAESSTTTSRSSKLASGGTTVQVMRTEEPLTEEEQMERVEQIRAMSRMFPTADPWGQHVETLDVMLPLPVSFATRSHFSTYRTMLDQFFKNRLNDGKNATSMLLLAREDAIPGIDLSEATLFQKLITKWPWKILTTQSTRAGSWPRPLRRIALSTYKDLNIAVAQRDDKLVKRLTTSTHQDNILRMLRKKQNLSHTYIWRFHREVNPTKVLSIRSTEGHLGNEDPKFGNRMMVHALIKFDTEQSLEVYDRRGKALHKQAEGGTSFVQGTVPAERKRVTEYLVLEKRMWYDGPWVFREQMYETPVSQ
ncbi:hypothetical protein AX17_003160 [Amanita inopinata Kibby_2008]|nr:hypothetical protein AX17_003160 [Amanita inopinata Kibby_2008]